MEQQALAKVLEIVPRDLVRDIMLEALNDDDVQVVIFAMKDGQWRMSNSAITNVTMLLGVLARITARLSAGS